MIMISWYRTMIYCLYWSHLLWWNPQGDCPQIYLLIRFNAGQDKEYSWKSSFSEFLVEKKSEVLSGNIIYNLRSFIPVVVQFAVLPTNYQDTLYFYSNPRRKEAKHLLKLMETFPFLHCSYSIHTTYINDLTMGWQNLNPLSHHNATLAQLARPSGEILNYLLSH